MRKLLRTVAGVVCGYALMVGLITLVQEGWFGGVGWGKTPLGVLAIAGLFTCVAAATGAVTATAIARPTGRVAAAIMSCLVIIETTTLIVTGKVAGPLWFDLLAAVSLIVAILVGAELFLRFTRLTARESAEAQPLAQPGRLAGGADAPSARRRLAWFIRPTSEHARGES